jgi:hypothetical protein
MLRKGSVGMNKKGEEMRDGVEKEVTQDLCGDFFTEILYKP